MSRSRRPLALLCGLLALAGLVVGSWAAAQFRSATLGRPWFAAATQLAVGVEGALYVGIGAGEVQVYAPDGAPRRAWYVDGGEPFRLRAGQEAGVELVYADDRVAPFDAEGRPGALRRETGAWERLGVPRLEDALPDGGRVALRPAGLVRLGASGQRVLVPAPPVPLAWLGARPLLPITLTLLAALGGLVACVALARDPERG